MLRGGDGLAVGREAQVGIVVRVLGDGGGFAGRQRDIGNLIAAVARLAAKMRNQQAAHVWEPGEIGDDAGLHRGERLPVGVCYSGRDLHGFERSKTAIVVKYRAGNQFSVGRPHHAGGRVVGGTDHERMLGGAIGVGDEQMISADFGVILTNIGDQAAVWRERNVRVHVLRDDLRRATEDGNAIDEANGLDGVFRAAKVDVVSVGRKSKTVVAARGGGKDLRVARSGDVAKPDALQAIIGYGADDVFAVGGDGGVDGFTGVGDLRDGEILEGHRGFAAKHGEDAVASDRKRIAARRSRR